MAKSSPRFGVVAGATCPVARQCPQCPEQSKQKEQLTPGNTAKPSPQRAQGWNDRRRGHPRRPHKSSCSRTDGLHRELFCLHAKEGEMLKDPTKSRRPALGISCPPNCIEEETNVYQPPDEPVCDGVRGEVEKNPCHDHGDDSHRCGVCRPGRSQCETCSENSGSLQAIADRN